MSVVRDNPARRRYEISESDRVIAFVDYVRRDNELTLVHAEVDTAHRGSGLARELVTAVLDDVRRQGLAALPRCGYVRKVIADDPDRFLDLVPVAARQRFGL